VNFILEQRGRDEQGERSKGLSLGSLGSYTLRSRISKHCCAPRQSLCKDAGDDQMN